MLHVIFLVPDLILSKQEDVRSFARRLMGRKNPEAPITDLASTAEVELFERTSKNGPTLKRFRVSLEGRLASLWNKRAAEIFAREFVRLRYRCQDETVVRKVFQTHLRYLRQLYVRQQALQNANVDSDDERIQIFSDQQRQMARNTRRRSVSVFYSCCLPTNYPALLALGTPDRSIIYPSRSQAISAFARVFDSRRNERR